MKISPNDMKIFNEIEGEIDMFFKCESKCRELIDVTKINSDPLEETYLSHGISQLIRIKRTFPFSNNVSLKNENA
jgi:hypothetical protein